MNRWVLVIAALACVSAHGADVKCGKRPPKWASVQDVTMTGPRTDEGATPAYYSYAQHSRLRIYLRPADVLKTIGDLVEQQRAKGYGDTASLEALAAEISKDQPLADHTDLGKYELRNPRFYITLEYVLSEALRRGRASFGDNWYFRADPAGKIVTEGGGVSWQMTRYDTVRMYSDRPDDPDFVRLFCSRDGRELFRMEYQIE